MCASTSGQTSGSVESGCDCAAALEQEIASVADESTILSKKDLAVMRGEYVAFRRCHGITDSCFRSKPSA